MIKPILVIDTLNIYVRYCYANLKNNYLDGALYGTVYFLSLLYRNIDDYSKIYFVLEGNSEENFRKKLFSEYKSNRKSNPEIIKNFNDFLKLLSKFPNSSIVKSNCGFEADDVISCIALNHAKKNKVIIYSNDKDFCQLCSNENIKLSNQYRDGKFILLTDEEIFNKFKDSKNQPLTDNMKDIIKWRIFLNDTSDNIPAPIKGLRKNSIKKIIEVWKEDKLSDKILGDIIIKLGEIGEDSLKWKIAENFDKIILSYRLSNLGYCGGHIALKESIKKLNINVSNEEIIEICNKYDLRFYRRICNESK